MTDEELALKALEYAHNYNYYAADEEGRRKVQSTEEAIELAKVFFDFIIRYPHEAYRKAQRAKLEEAQKEKLLENLTNILNNDALDDEDIACALQERGWAAEKDEDE